MTRIIAICSQKGGVGKTTTAVNLAAMLTHARHRTLLIDLDPQGNATSGVSRKAPRLSPLALLSKNPGAADWDRVTVPTDEPNLSLVPSGPGLVEGLDLEGVAALGETLRGGLLERKPPYQTVVIDTPPTLGPTLDLALDLADSVIIPVQCEYYAMEGLSQMLDVIRGVQRAGRRPLEIEGFLLTMFDEELQLAHDVSTELEKHFPQETFRTIIPRDVTLAECASHGKPVCEYNLRSRGAWAYLQLAKEIIENVGQSKKTGSGPGLPDPKKRHVGARQSRD